MAYKVFSNGDALTGGELNTFLMNQSVIQFASSAARDAAIPAPNEGQLVWLQDSNKYVYYTGSAWANLIVPSTTNALINGGFDIWQRGTSFTNPSSTAYTADRWNNAGNSGGTTTITRESTGTPDGSSYHLRTAYGSASSYSNKSQIIETSNVVQFWGKSATLSLKVRRNASFTSNLNVTIQKSATVDASQIATWSDIGQVVVSNASMPTGTTSVDWYSTELTFSVPSDGTANSLRIVVGEASAGVSGAYWELAQVQLEAGSVATPFKRNASNIQGELAACQRYYYRHTATTSGEFGITMTGYSTSSTIAVGYVFFPVQLRARPTSVDFSSVRFESPGNVATGNITAVALTDKCTQTVGSVNATTSGMTTGQTGWLNFNNSATAFFGWSAEL